MPTSTSVEHAASQVGSVSSYPDVNHQSRLLPFCLPTPPAPPPHPAPLRIWAPLSSGVLKEKRASACECLRVGAVTSRQQRMEGLGRKADGLRHEDCSHHNARAHTHTHTLAQGPAVVLFLKLSELTPSFFLCPGLDAFCSHRGS